MLQIHCQVRYLDFQGREYMYGAAIAPRWRKYPRLCPSVLPFPLRASSPKFRGSAHQSTAPAFCCPTYANTYFCSDSRSARPAGRPVGDSPCMRMGLGSGRTKSLFARAGCVILPSTVQAQSPTCHGEKSETAWQKGRGVVDSFLQCYSQPGNYEVRSM